MKKFVEKKNCEKKLKNFVKIKKKYFSEKKIRFFLWRIFSLKIAIGICIGIGICICIGICKFCKEYSTLKKSKKISYLRLKIVWYLITYLLSDKVGHRNSVPLFKNMVDEKEKKEENEQKSTHGAGVLW